MSEQADERRVSDEVNDRLEDAGLAAFVTDRLATTSGQRLTAEEFLGATGMSAHIARLPER